MIELLNCDCMTYMKTVPDKFFDLAIVDPPYGASDAINPKSSENKYQAKRSNYKEFENIRPSEEYFSELKRVSKNQIVWAAIFSVWKAAISVGIKTGRLSGRLNLLFVQCKNQYQFLNVLGTA